MKEQEKSKIIEIIEWIKENRKPFFTTLLSVVIVALVVVFVCVRIHLVNLEASDKLNMATKIFAGGDTEQGILIIDDLMNTYKNSPAAYRAMIMKASYLINQKQYDEAENLLKIYIEKAKPETVKPIGYPLLISIYDDNNNIEQAIAVSKDFISKYSDNYLAPSVMENMARLYELSGKQEEAKQVYKDIVDKFFGTIYANRASDKLK
jgi:predicted negative regulator of RcsB-dependent stress response